MKTLCTLVLMCICLESLAQNIQLKGTVGNGDKQPIEFANVVLQTTDSILVTGTTSNLKGHFELNGINAGTYRLLISSMGYRTQEIWLNDLSQSRDCNGYSLSPTERSGPENRLSVGPPAEGLCQRRRLTPATDASPHPGRPGKQYHQDTGRRRSTDAHQRSEGNRSGNPCLAAG